MSEQEEFTEQDDARASIHQVSHIQPENPDTHKTSSGSTELYTAPRIKGRTRAKHQMAERDSPLLEKKKKYICTDDEAFEHIGNECTRYLLVHSVCHYNYVHVLHRTKLSLFSAMRMHSCV